MFQDMAQLRGRKNCFGEVLNFFKLILVETFATGEKTVGILNMLAYHDPKITRMF